jgi:S1/P1 Nuclease
MTNRILAALALLFALLPAPAAAWWEYGHTTIADIAMAEAKPQTRAAIRRLVAQSRLLETPTCPVRSLADASVWPDCIKALRERFSYQSSWHYQNVDICQPFDLKGPCKDGNCVSAQITRNAKLLGDKSLPPRERLMALAFLAHFVGDLHMPLHAGDRSDRGGNDQKASYGDFAGSRLNIHSVWDGYLAERAISSPPGRVAGLRAGLVPAMADGSVEDWSREGWTLARDIYAAAQSGDPCGPRVPRAANDNARIEALVPVIRLQMQRGGLRLARLLDLALE